MSSSLPYWLASDVTFLKQHDDVTSVESTYLCLDDVLFLNIKIMLRFDPQFSKPSNKLVENPEEITLRYVVSAKRNAPIVLASRGSFPDNLPHLNLRSEGSNEKSLCLWSSGTSQLYNHHGIERLLQVLQEWLADARDGTLCGEEWEPAPLDRLFVVDCDIKEIQRIAEKGVGKILRGVAFIWKRAKFLGVGRISTAPNDEASLSNKQLKRKDKNKYKHKINDMQFDCYLICSDKDACYDDPLRYFPKSIDTFQKLLPQENTAKFCKFLAGRDFKSKGGVLAIFAVRRPSPMQSAIAGLSSGKASHNDLLSFWINSEENGVSIEQVALTSAASTELLSGVSGEKKFFLPVNVVGCGSVGSSLAVMLARSGIGVGSLFDPDFLLPHNNARHECETGRKAPDLLLKVRLLAAKLNSISDQYLPKIVPEYLTESNVHKLKVGHVLDTTGENNLESLWIRTNDKVVHRVMIADNGKVGVLQSQNLTHNPNQANLLDIEGQIYVAAQKNQKVRKWLASDGVLSNRLLGFGCSSATMEMPWATIQNHCSSLFPALKTALNSKKSGVSLNFLSRDGKPEEYFELDLPLFKTIISCDDTGADWTVRLSGSAEEFLLKTREADLPNEAGGFLVGLVNIEEHFISIAGATTGACNATPTNVELESGKNDEELMDILAVSNYKLGVLGTWHSHCGESAQPSPTDIKTLGEIAKYCVVGPSIMVIIAEKEIVVNVRTPDEWKKIP